FFPATTVVVLYTLPLHDALPIFGVALGAQRKTVVARDVSDGRLLAVFPMVTQRAFGVTIAQFADFGTCDYNSAVADRATLDALADRKSTRLNSSHVKISYAVFCL